MSTQFTSPTNEVPILPVDPQNPPAVVTQQKIERRKTYGPLREYLMQTIKRIEEQDKEKWRLIRETQNRCQAFYDDRQYGKFNDRGEWVDDPYNPRELKVTDNQYQIQIDKLLMEMARGQLELTVRAADEDDADMVEGAAFFKTRIDANRKRLFTRNPAFGLAENMALLLKTITFRYTHFSLTGGKKEKRPYFGAQRLGREMSSFVCGQCGQPTNGTEPCPECGSSYIKQVQVGLSNITDWPVDEQEHPVGRVETVHVDPSMVTLWLGARVNAPNPVSSSPYLIYSQMLMRGVIEQAHPDKVIPSTKDDDQSRQRRENEGASNSLYQQDGDAQVGGEQFEEIKYDLVWLDSWIYADYVSDVEEELPNGQKLPVGMQLGKLIPDGMCVAKVATTPLMIYAEDKNKKWSLRVYGIREHALHGAGTNSLIARQVTINDLASYRLANIYYNTNRREFIKNGAFDGNALPKLDEVCVVNDVPENRNIIGGAYEKAAGDGLPADVKEFQSEQMGSLQEGAGTSSLSQAGTQAQTEALGTATGIAAMRDQAVGRMGPNLMLGAAHEVEHAYQMGELEQDNYSLQHMMGNLGKRATSEKGDLKYTARGIQAFMNADLRTDFLIEPAQGSWMPTTEQERKADTVQFTELMPALAQAGDKELVAHVAKVFKQPMKLEGWNATEREAARRIEEFAKIARLMQGRSEPIEILAQEVLVQAADAQLNVEMDNHPAFIEFHRDWWVGDEGVQASPVLKKTVEMRTAEHKDAMVADEQDKNARTIETQVPNKLAQMASNELDAQQQQGMAQEQVGQQQEMTQAEDERAAAQMQAEQDDREHKAGVEMLKGEHAQDLKERGAMVEMANREHQVDLQPEREQQ